jgi:membrane protein DedA with SNARE-associated domain
MHHLLPLVAAYGYAAVFGLLLIESIGIPVPGEGVLIAAALFAARTHRLDIVWVLAAGSLAAFLGSCIGYLLGRSAGVLLLTRYGGYVGLTEARLRLGRYLFLRHGAKLVFLGRFVAFLRAFEGILAGANLMGWRRFLVINALGLRLRTGLHIRLPSARGGPHRACDRGFRRRSLLPAPGGERPAAPGRRRHPGVSRCGRPRRLG